MMLAEEDQQLARRDPAITALPYLLDPMALTTVIKELLPSCDIRKVTVEYLRYKPATSCLAKLQLQTSEGLQSAYTIAYRQDDGGKIAKAVKISQDQGNRIVFSQELKFVVLPFPFDRHLTSLARINSEKGLHRLIERMGPRAQPLIGSQIETLRYKPERRYVGKLAHNGAPMAVLRLYSRSRYISAKRAFKSLGRRGSHPNYWGASDLYAAMAISWLPGKALSLTDSIEPISVAAQTLAKLHCFRSRNLPRLVPLDGGSWARRARKAVETLRTIAPGEVPRAESIIPGLLDSIAGSRGLATLHGDVHLEQFIVDKYSGRVSLIDFDHACLGPREWDLATFLADLQRRAVTLDQQESTNRMSETFIEAYDGLIDRNRLNGLVALRLLETSVEPFRTRAPDWQLATRQIIDASLDQMVKSPPATSFQTPYYKESSTQAIVVDVPDTVLNDSELPLIKEATDPQQAAERLSKLTPADSPHRGLNLSSIRVVRHKQGRRCLIEYSGESQTTGETITLLGKMESKPRSKRRFQNQLLLWNAGFDTNSPDGVSVARPWGEAREWRMWFQEKTTGVEASQLIQGDSRKADTGEADTGVAVVEHLAKAIAKLHEADLPVGHHHSVEDEAHLIKDRLDRAALRLPDIARRLHRLAEECCEQISLLPSATETSVHRDFYLGQALLDDGHTTLVDFDLLCRSDPAIDLGNFIGCLHDFGLRNGWPDDRIQLLTNRFLSAYSENDSDELIYRINTYATLTLARHIWLCLQIPKREKYTMAILDAAEQSMQSLNFYRTAY